jgi:hypothetical protein
LCDPKGTLFIENGVEISERMVKITSRVGIQSTPEPWLSKPWRYFADLSKDKNPI